VQLPFGRVFVREVGQGGEHVPPLLLLHGMFVTHWEFRRVLEPLSAGRRVLAIDLPGCGESDRPAPSDASGYSLEWLAGAVVEIAGALGLGRFDLLGHSFGGAVALLVAGRCAAVERLILVDPVCFSMELPLEGRLALVPGLGRLLVTRAFGRAELERHMRRAWVVPGSDTADALDVYWDRLARRGGREAAHAMMGNFARLDVLREELVRARCPALVVWGDRDAIVPPEHADRLVRALADARSVTIEGCGHAPNEERPEELVRAIEAFLRGQPRAPS
jgi:pimeloyl-ACP methyl ester carboxylesterase